MRYFFLKSFKKRILWEQVNWVAYVLIKDPTVAKFKRSNKFKLDPLVKTGSADDADYKGSCYNRGHLAPAGDMAWSKVTLDESFYYSNMTPQLPGFNRGVWKRLETQVRKWANEYQKLYIVTGPVIAKGLKKIGHLKTLHAYVNYFGQIFLVKSVLTQSLCIHIKELITRIKHMLKTR